MRKGRSSAFRLNQLCRILLATEIIYGVRFHIRWIPTELMPADKFTRSRTYLAEQGSERARVDPDLAVRIEATRKSEEFAEAQEDHVS